MWLLSLTLREEQVVMIIDNYADDNFWIQKG